MQRGTPEICIDYDEALARFPKGPSEIQDDGLLSLSRPCAGAHDVPELPLPA